MSTHHRLLQILSVIVILSMMFSAFSVPVASAQKGDGIKRQHNAQTGKVSFIGPESGRALPATKALGISSASARPVDPAMALAKRFGPEFGLKNPARDLKEKTSHRSDNGRLAVHYQQSYQGVPVIGGELIVNTNENGDLYSISGEVSSDISLSTQPTVDSERARQTALTGAAEWYQKTSKDFLASEPELWIYDESLLQPSTRPMELVWRMEVTPKDMDIPVRELVLVNAQRGSISLHFNQNDTTWSLEGKTNPAQDSQPTETPLPTEDPTENPDAVGTATPTPTPAQPQSDGASATSDLKHNAEALADSTWYVSTAGNDANSCSAPASPCATIQGAINKASNGNTIKAAEGTYYYTSINANPNVVIINKSITLSGGWQSDFSGQTGASIIDGQSVNNGILANAVGSTVVVDHFVVQNSHTGSDSGGIYLYSTNFILSNSSIINNTGGRGAGIFMIGASNLLLLNSTISGNVAGSSGGAIHAVNGGITINNSTIAYNNSNVTGGGIRNESGTVSLRNSILALNTATTSGPDCSGAIDFSNHNIIGNIAGCTVTAGTGDQFNINPLINAPLTGALPLHALQPTSPAVNTGDNVSCLSIDQRGIARPQGSVCDIGAYELVALSSISVVNGSNQSAQVSTAFASPLSVLVIDDLGNPASGLTVTFTAPASGASGTFTDTGTNVTTAITGSNGVATSTVFTANNQAGGYSVNATADGYDSPAAFDLSNTPVSTANFYVSPSGSDASACNSPASPCLTINGAINKAAAGNTIAVASGTYTSSGTEVVQINKSVTLSGGWNNTFSLQDGTSIIDGQGARRAVVNTATGTSIENFTLQGGYHATQGGGIYNNGALTLSKSDVSGNVSEWMGGGIFTYGTLIINNSSIRNNRAGTTGHSGGGGGAGIQNYGGTVVMNNSTIVNNVILGSYQASGIVNFGASFTINNSTISGNTGADAIYHSAGGGTLALNNSTVSRNAKFGIRNNSGTVILQNSILANNSTVASGQDCSGTITSSGYNLIGNTTGCAFISGIGDQTNVNAMLSTYWIGSPAYHTLLSGSPAINAGNPATCLPTDQRGMARPQGAACDIGAYEYTTPGTAASLGITNGNNQRAGLSLPFALPLIAYVVDDAGSPVSGVEIEFTAPDSGPSGIFADTGTNVTTASTNSEGVAVSSTFTANSQLGTYQVIATGTSLSGSVSFVLTNGAWFVSPIGNDSNSCTSPSTSCLTINAAIGKAQNKDVIKIAAGIYTGTSSAVVMITKNLVLSGGWDSSFSEQTGFSIIDGQNTRVGISANSTDTSVNVAMDHFIIQNGYTSSSGGGIYSSIGSFTINNSLIINNRAGNSGGGVLIEGNLTVNNSTIRNNVASGNGGGGIAVSYLKNSLTLNNSTVTGNQTVKNGGGIILYNGSGGTPGTVLIQNSTIVNNSSASGGGLENFGTASRPVNIRNTIIANNTAISGGPDCQGPISFFDHSLLGNTDSCTLSAGSGNLLNIDPRVSTSPIGIWQYHPLRADSPAIEAGDPATCLATDQRGVARPQGTICDMGAYEYTAPGAAAALGIASGSNQHSGLSLPFQSALVVYVMDAAGSPVSGVEVTFTAPASGPSGTFADTQTFTTVATTNDNGMATSPVFIANSQMGSYNVIATVIGVSDPASFTMTNATWFVAPTGSDTNSCNSPSSPCLTINGVVAKAANGDGVMVAAGTYAPASITKSLTLLGGWDTTFASRTGRSIVDANAASDGITVSGENVSMSRFVVRNSYYGINHRSGSLSFEQGALINNRNGIYNYAGDTTFTNTTISGNQSTSMTGSAISNANGTVLIRYSTISNNGVSEAIYSLNSGARVIIGDSILAGNPVGDCRAGSANMTSTGHNVFGRSPICSGSPSVVPDPTDQVGTDPQLLPLSQLGYHPLSPTSPAVNHANPATCPATDQRDMARPQGIACDIGSYEYSSAGLAASIGINSGSNQRTGPFLPFSLPLAVYVVDADGNPVDGVTVTFTAPASGPSGTFADTGTNTTSAVSIAGIATSSVFTANSQLGNYNVVAAVDGLSGSANFSLANAAWFVAPIGSDSNSCSVSTSPCLTISGAMAKAVNGETIMVAVGTYPTITIGKSLTLSGGWNNTFTSRTGYSTIQGDGGTSSYGITTGAPIVSVSGFIVQNNHDGIHHSGGILNFERGALIDNNNGISNQSGDTTFINTTISGNHALGTLGSAINNPGGTVRIRYSTITNNSGTEAIWSQNGSAHIEIGDSILAGNPDGDCRVGSTNMISIGHNIFGRSPVCSGSSGFVPDSTDQVGVNPQLLPLYLLGYHPLSQASPAVDHANPATCPATDQRGTTRPQGAACDIGAFEYSTPGPAASFGIISGSNQRTGPSLPFILPLAVYVIDATGNPVSGATVTFTAPASGPSGTFADTGTNTTTVVSTAGTATSPAFTANSQMGTYNIVATVAGVSGSQSFTLTNVAWFVAPTGSDSNACNVSTAPCLTISGAMTKAAAGDAILVAAGAYPPITISKSLSLWGGWDNAFTSRIGYSTISGTSTTDGLTVSGPEVFISRFIVQNSYFGIRHNGGTLRFDQGASINNSNGLYNYDGDLIFTNTTISGNYVRATQGVYYAGSAISNVDGLIRIQYSTITNNGGTEALWSTNGSAQIEIGSSILAGNPGGDCPSSGVNMTSVGHNLLGPVSLCDVVPQATDHVGVDPKLMPLFLKGYHPLSPDSPAIDAADPLNCPATDQRGVARPAGTACDIGAVEYSSTGTMPKYIFADQGSPQIILINSPAASRLVAVVFDENGNIVQGRTVTFTAPDQGPSVIFADTGTNTSTVVTDVNGLATSPAFSANNLAGSYVVIASVDGADTPAGFSLSNSTTLLNPKARTYTANNDTTLPGTFLCDQTKPGCTDRRDPHADAAHKYALGTYAFYAAQHNRDSIDNAGMTIISSVHVSSGYANAGWTGSQMVYGDAYGFPLADDVVGHELTHGVTQYESNLFYYYQSGAINESFSDLWGEYYDQSNGLGNDDASVQWLMGEDVTGLGAIRSMSNPPQYGNPDKMSSSNYYTGAIDNGGVHTNSGVNNKAVFLMVAGGSFNGKTVSALGWEKTAAIYYEANANLLSSGADYSDLYYALQQACTNLIGQKGITSADCLTVKDALDAVEMNAQPVPNFNPDAPDCDEQERPSIVFSDDLESGTGNWTFSNGSTLRWQLDSIYGPNAHSGSHSLYADDYPPAVTDASARLASIVIPEGAYLHFAHAYDFQSSGSYYYDGGVLEYSIDGGATWNDAGSLMDFNGYNGPIRTGSGNPLQGRSAFGGSSHGYISTRLNLASLAGQTVSFRWRMGLDQATYAWGWWLDDVKIYQCVPEDTTAPTVVSIARAGTDPTSAASVEFSVTFSEPVTGVDLNDFALDATGNVAGASITNVNGSGSTWTVSVDTGSGDGTLGLRVPVDVDIKDTAGNLLDSLPFTGGEQYTLDKTAPFISSITRVSTTPWTNAASVDFRATFSEPVTGVDIGDFSLDIKTGNIADATITGMTAEGDCVTYCSTYVVTVNTGSGSGLLGVKPVVIMGVTDSAGNLLGDPPYYFTSYYSIDKIMPVVSSIVRGSADPTSADSVDFTVTFPEDVTGVDTAAPFNDFILNTTGVTGAAISGVSGSGATWIVTVNTGSGDGTLGLDLAAGARITDLAGNMIQPGPFAPDEEYTIDKTHAFLIAPVNGEALLYRRPIFDWSDVPGASGYRITASRSSTFSTILWEVETIDSIYTPGADLPGGQVIYWRVSAQLNGVLAPWSETWNFTTGNPPSVPGLTSPANGSLTRDYTPLLNWNDSTVPTGAAAFDHYEVQVAIDALFTHPVLIDEVTPTGQITASSYTPAIDLAANTTYFWRVRSYNVNGQYSSWSTVRSFRTALLPPSNLTPNNGVTVSSRKPILDWDAVAGAEGYNIQISTSSSFGSLLVNTSTTTDTFTPTSNLPANKTIYWRVRTTGVNGPGNWTTASFKTP